MFITNVLFLLVCYTMTQLKVTAMEGIVETLSGQSFPHVGAVDTCVDDSSSLDGNLLSARFNYPWGIAFDGKTQTVYVADCGCPDSFKDNDLIRKIDLKEGLVSTIAGSKQGFRDGLGKQARFFHVAGLIRDQYRDVIYIADSGNDAVRLLELKSLNVTTFAGKARNAAFKDGPADKARFNKPQQVEMKDSSTLYVADTDNHAVRIILLDKKPPVVKTLTGGPDRKGFQDGSTNEARWKHPTGLAYDSYRDVLYVADHYNHAIRKIDLQNGQVTTLVGNGSPGNIHQQTASGSVLHYPEGIAYDRAHDVLYFAEFTNNCIRMITLADNKVHVLAGGEFGTRDAVGRDAQFYHPTSLDFDADRKILYVTDQYNHRIRTVTTLGNIQIGHPNMMILKHFGRVDAFRDVVVHKSGVKMILFYITIALIVTLILGKKLLVKYQRHQFGFFKKP